MLDKKPKKTAFSKEEVSQIISENKILKQYIKEKLKLSDKQIKGIIQRGKEILLPISIFKNRLSTLEVIVKYLKEIKKISFVEISYILKRNQRTIWHAYHRTIKKDIPIKVLESKIKIPVSIFSDRKYSPLEILVTHLRDSYKLKFTEIAALLNLSPKTIWTVYQRVKNKNAKTK